MPGMDAENPLFNPDPTLYNVRKLTETLKTAQERGHAIAEALHFLSKEPDRTQAFPTPIVEVRDNKGVRKYKFQVNYAQHLTMTMELVSSILNDYLQATLKPRTFSFRRSEHYNMEFAELVYKHWATRLILESFECRLLARIQLAKESIEAFINESEFRPGEGPPKIASPAFSTSTIFASEVNRILTTDQAVTQGGSPSVEDKRWEQQLLQEIDVSFTSMVAATAHRLSLNEGLADILKETAELPTERSRLGAETDARRHSVTTPQDLPAPVPHSAQKDETTLRMAKGQSTAQGSVHVLGRFPLPKFRE